MAEAVASGIFAGRTSLCLVLTTSIPPWMQSGTGCAGQDPELFFPYDYTKVNKEQVDAAKELCLSCPVRQECLEWALFTGADEGIWGGLTPAERRRLKKERKCA